MLRNLTTVILLILLLGCTQAPLVQVEEATSTSASAVTGVSDLLLTADDLLALNIPGNATSCRVEAYETGEYSSLAEYGFCAYNISLDQETEVIIELKKFTNGHDRNGSYQYESLHLRSSEGLLSENTYGDMSRFSVNNEHDYGAEFNVEGIFYYHLWVAKDAYLLHVTSKGSEDAKERIEIIGKTILSKFG